MSQFVFAELVNSPLPDIKASLLGTAAGPGNGQGQYFQNDVGKPVKMGNLQNHSICAAGDEIEGFIHSMEAATDGGGFSFGSVIRDSRIRAKVDAAQAGAIAIGAYVVAGASAAIGTADAAPKVKAGTPATFKWRVIRIITGTGVAGDFILIERV